MKGLTIYDPRIEDRVFYVTQAKAWSSKENNILFLETDNYAFYSNSTCTKKLLNVLITETKVAKLALRISNFKYSSPPNWLERSLVSKNVLTGIANIDAFDQIAELFDTLADYQTWDFFGLHSYTVDLSSLELFPDVLTRSSLFPFILEIDLDAILLGYVHPRSDMDSLIEILKDLSC